jgi:acyl carrier protein
MAITRERIIKIIANTFNLKVADITDDMSYGQHEKWDSIQHLTLIVALEKEFKKSFEPEEIQEMTTIEKIMQHIELKSDKCDT